MRSFQLYRYDATGIFGYVCYGNDHKICNISSIVSPESRVCINSESLSMMSNYSYEDTLVPGSSKRIIVDMDDMQIAALRWDGHNSYTLFFDRRDIIIYKKEQGYVFSLKGEPVANLKRAEDQHCVPQAIKSKELGYNIELAYYLEIHNQYPSIFDYLIMGFPMLKFAF